MTQKKANFQIPHAASALGKVSSVVFVSLCDTNFVSCVEFCYFRLSLYNRDQGGKSFNPLTPNDPYRVRTAPLTSKCCILYIYSTNIGTEYFKYGINSPFFFSSKCSLFHNSNVFGSCIIRILYTGCAKIKKK